MSYSNLTFQVQPNLSFKTHDFVNLSGEFIPNTSTTTTSTTVAPTTTSTTTTTTTLNVISSGLRIYVDASNPASYSGSGSTWYDLSGNGYNGTLSGSTAYNSANGGYIALQSNTGYIDFGLSSAESSSSPYTFGVWLQVPIIGTTVPMCRGNDTTGSFPAGWNLATVVVSGGFNASIVTSVPSIAQTNAVYSTAYSTNTWYYHISVWNPSAGTLKVYINGILRATQNTSGTVLRNSGTGWNTTTASTKYDCSLGSMIVYNTVLSDAEILQNFNSTKTRFGY
jgi:hypothetical protein